MHTEVMLDVVTALLEGRVPLGEDLALMRELILASPAVQNMLQNPIHQSMSNLQQGTDMEVGA